MNGRPEHPGRALTGLVVSVALLAGLLWLIATGREAVAAWVAVALVALVVVEGARRLVLAHRALKLRRELERPFRPSPDPVAPRGRTRPDDDGWR